MKSIYIGFVVVSILGFVLGMEVMDGIATKMEAQKESIYKNSLPVCRNDYQAYNQYPQIDNLD